MKIEKWIWIALIAIGFALTPFAFRYADAVRGFDATGGEVAVPLIVPFLFWMRQEHKAFWKGIRE